jgi:hypothetical protein
MVSGVVIIVVATLGLAAIDSPRADPPAAAPAAGTGPALLALPDGPRAPRPAKARRIGRPVHLQIPAAGVDARVIRLGLNADGTLEVPRRFQDTGWWSGGARPGEPGPAVIAGHVDSHTGPAVFFRLGRLRRGDVVRVIDRRGTVVRFAVQRVAHYSKSHFPTRAVYGATPKPVLRLITCSGDFDRATGHYVDNTVVYAKQLA